jgi:hypothetical protein
MTRFATHSIKTFVSPSTPLAYVQLVEEAGGSEKLALQYDETRRHCRWALAYCVLTLLLTLVAGGFICFGTLSSDAEFSFVLLLFGGGGLFALAVVTGLANLVSLLVSQKLLLVKTEMELYEAQEELQSLRSRLPELAGFNETSERRSAYR